MIFTETKLKKSFIIEPERRSDERGFFARVWCTREFQEHGLTPRAVQSNMSYNYGRGTLRGMHFQREPHGEAKLIRCVRGAIYDVILDLRPESPTYTQWIGVELTQDNRKLLYVPEGFGHGFITLTDDTEVFYHVSEFYHPESEGGIRWNDPAFQVEWPLEPRIISEKDRSWPDFKVRQLT
ncbi:MAG: dTDP-4-dehydrorhamnose 3,5-epimerase [Candidatus Korobacteraceae bacterium]